MGTCTWLCAYMHACVCLYARAGPLQVHHLPVLQLLALAANWIYPAHMSTCHQKSPRCD